MAAKAKTKMPALDVPQSDGAADDLLKTYGGHMNALARLQATMNDGLAKVKAEFEAEARPIIVEMTTIEAQLTAFGAAHRDRLTEGGKSKTITLPAGTMSWRAKPASVQFDKGLKARDIIHNIRERMETWAKSKKSEVAILAAHAQEFIRIKVEVDKDAMLKHEDIATKIPGVTIGSLGEDFILTPFGAELAESKP
jgi:phage host-nuclease inhibitor protein Gam